MIYQGQVKCKAGTLPFNICTVPHIHQQRKRAVSPTQPFPDDVETKASDIQPHDQQDATSFDVSDDSDEVQEYDIDSNVM